MRYTFRLDFGTEGDPPEVCICDAQAQGVIVVTVHEEPTLRPGRGEPSDHSDSGRWSWEEEDWEAGPLARQILALLNDHPPP